MDYKKLELKLLKIVEKRLEEGWWLYAQGGAGFIHENYALCCLLGAVGIEYGCSNGVLSSKLEERLTANGFTTQAMLNIERGFDGGRGHSFPVDPELIAIGARIRRDYVETK